MNRLHRTFSLLAATASAMLFLVAGAPSASAAALPNASNPSFPYFGSPSGRLCGEIRREKLIVTNYSWSAKGQAQWVVGQRGRAYKTGIMGNAPSEFGPSDKLRYGKRYTYGRITLTVNRLTGITVRNASGHGFTVSVERQRIF
jgi:hypothetical protein